MRSRQRFPLTGDSVDQGRTRERLAARADMGWLTLERCRVCGEHWFVAEDQINDDLYLQRLDAEVVRSILGLPRRVGPRPPGCWDAFAAMRALDQSAHDGPPPYGF
jgi:hypothetical protein